MTLRKQGAAFILLAALVPDIALLTLFTMTPAVTAGRPWYVDVTSGDDGNDCLTAGTACLHISEAIGKATSGDTVNIAAGLYPQSFSVVGKNLTIIGAGSSKTILDGGGVNRVARIDDADVSLSGLTLQNGWTKSSSGGGGLFIVDADAIIDDIIFRNNTSEGYNGGGLMVNSPLGYTTTLTMSNARFENNTAARGGGLFTSMATASLENVSVTGNTNVEDSSGSLQLLGGKTTLTNVTVSGSSHHGIHVTNFGAITLTNSTLAENTGFGLSSYGTIASLNNIFSGNNDGGNNCFLNHHLALDSLGHSIDGGDSCQLDHHSDLTSTDPQLQPLADYGNRTLIFALAPTSPALDGGDNTGCPTTDQRGVTRPLDGDGNASAICDIGAFEYARVGAIALSLEAPADGITDSGITFKAIVAPDIATRPLTFTWSTAGQPTVERQSGYTDSLIFSWSTPGEKTVNVKAGNQFGQASADHTITITVGVLPLSSVTIDGPSQGTSGNEYTFSALSAPTGATLPITYTWKVGNEAPVNQVGGISDQLAHTWNQDGAYTIVVTATNPVNTVTNSHLVTISAWYVNGTGGSNANGCQSWGDACKTVQEAVNRSSSGDTIRIAAGTYVENIEVPHGLYIGGAGAGTTILDGGKSGSVLEFDDSSGSLFTATLRDVTIQNGSQSGLSNSEKLTLINTIVQYNGATSNGGGIFNSGTLSMTDSTIAGNTTTSSGAALFNTGLVNLSAVTVSGNDSNNSILHTQNNGIINLVNVTVSGNLNSPAVVTSGSAQATVLNSTFAYNPGGGIANHASLTLQNTVLAENGNFNCWTPITSLGYNLEDLNTCGLNATGDQKNISPLLFPLGWYGGPTQTHAMAGNSTAIDAANDAACPAADQRGVARPIDGDKNGPAVCDIGAYEFDLLNTLNLPMITR